ncbi:hypothetical protein [Polyangium sp. 6x1]|uniref:hypothetical protein n=1 Tax=Polyangium sp. 6x1 TaxID=3042689 RepID=UPI0024825EB6|nr:hypothetical protein [Polyangium sp. 6x1]MDI1444132.1 hypothetical protein [Polyangium sp. 6x1]
MLQPNAPAPASAAAPASVSAPAAAPTPALAPAPSRVPRLSLPYAVLGAVGGWMAADFFRVGALKLMDAGLRPAFVVVTPLCALLLGVLVQPTVHWPRRAAAFLAAAVGVLSAGLMGGALIGVMRWSRWGLGEGAATGFVCALGFLPAFALVLAAARRVGRARPGSLVDRADRRAVWLAVAVSVALGTLAALPDWNVFPTGVRPSLEVSRTLGVAAVAAIFALCLGDAVALARALRVERLLSAMRPASADDPRVAWSPRKLDLGLGEETRASVLSAAVVYREHDRVLSVVRGNPRDARRALLGAFACGVVALGVGGACVSLTGARTASAADATAPAPIAAEAR